MNISVIIPIHKCGDKETPLLNRAFETILTQEKIEETPKVYLVFPTSIEKNVIGWRDSIIRKYQNSGVTENNFELVVNDGKYDFQSQINLGVSKVKTDYFSILEFDDEYSTTYFYNVEKHISHYNDVDIFLSMMIEVNEKNEAIKVTNEVIWSQQFVGENGEMGFLNLNAIKQNTDFKISGSIINKEEFLNLGGLKSNIKLTFNYEFLLRALNNACKIFTIPKIGYKHLSGREDSLFYDYGKNMSMEERKFWFETANKEANFTNDRIIDTSLLKQVVQQSVEK